MSDNITLPRKLVKHLKWVLEEGLMHGDCTERSAIEALRTALAAPSLEVTVDPRLTPDEAVAISSALAAPRQEPEPVRHPGYIIGSHWLETAYSRICAGEAEADVLRDCGWERVGDAEALRLNDARYRWIRDNHEIKGRAMEIVYNSNGKEWDADIDWAMQEDKT